MGQNRRWRRSNLYVNCQKLSCSLHHLCPFPLLPITLGTTSMKTCLMPPLLHPLLKTHFSHETYGPRSQSFLLTVLSFKDMRQTRAYSSPVATFLLVLWCFSLESIRSVVPKVLYRRRGHREPCRGLPRPPGPTHPCFF